VFPGNNMNQMMKQIQKMQQSILKAQEEIGNMTVEGTAGGGAVKVVMSGKKEVKSITLSKDVVDPEDLEMLQDLLVAALADAYKNAEELTENEMKKVTGGMPRIPGLF
jgi:DNA-binding YbaB/EbfC family protein